MAFCTLAYVPTPRRLSVASSKPSALMAGTKILHADHFLAKRLVDQRTVGKRKEHAIRVHLAQFDKVLLAHQRFTTRVNIHMRAQLFYPV